MKYIPMNILEYRFDERGITQTIVVAFQQYRNEEQLNARVILDQNYVNSLNDSLVLDSMNKEQIESFARRKLRDLIVAARPEVDPEVEPEVDPEVEE